MKIAKSARIFNLATSLTDYDDEISHNLYNRLKFQNNLFHQEAIEKNYITNFDKNRTYDYVGVKQLREYYERGRRVSKEKKRETMLMNLGFSRHSVKSNKEEQAYSKYQIIQKVEKNIDRNHISFDENTMAQDLTMRENMSGSICLLNASKRIQSKVQSSILKMKRKHNNYKQNWEKQQKKAQNMKGFPSLLRLTTQSRSMSRKKDLNQQQFLRQNINQRMWSTVLREQKQLKFVHDKQLTKFIQKQSKLSVNGKNKLRLQKQWINKKGEQGYRFQLLKKPKTKA